MGQKYSTSFPEGNGQFQAIGSGTEGNRQIYIDNNWPGRYPELNRLCPSIHQASGSRCDMVLRSRD